MQRYFFIRYATYISIFFTASCSAPWIKPGFTAKQWSADNIACISQAATSFPPIYAQYESSQIVESDHTVCTSTFGNVRCVFSGEPDNSVSIVQDFNQSNRESEWEDCIKSKGYFVEKDEKQVVAQDPIRKAINDALVASDMICERPEYQSFFDKSACKETSLTIAQLSDNTKASDEERIIISLFRKEGKDIEEIVATTAEAFGDDKQKRFAQLITRYTSLADQNFLDLYERKITFGAFNKKRKELFDRMGNDVNQLI